MSDTPFDDLLEEMVRDLVARRNHAIEMEVSMAWNETFKGVPYGPALNETGLSQLRGIMSVVDQRNRAERRAAKKGRP